MHIPKLSALDLDHLKAGGFCDGVVLEYVRFMTLVMMPRESARIPYAPSRAVDAVWCHHMLDSDLYARFCGWAYVNRDESKITRTNYLNTLENFATTDRTFWPSDGYLTDDEEEADAVAEKPALPTPNVAEKPALPTPNIAVVPTPTLSEDDLAYFKHFNDAAITEYLRFMTLVKNQALINWRTDQLAPSKAVDTAWRCHMDAPGGLYVKFVARLFGVPNIIVPRVQSAITRANYLATREKLLSTFLPDTVSEEFWPAEEYKDELTFTAADLDRPPKDVFSVGRPERLVDAFTFLRTYLAHRMASAVCGGAKILTEDGGRLLRASGLFPGGLAEFKAALVGCIAMHVACGRTDQPSRSLRSALADFVGEACMTPKLPEDGGDLVEWLGRFPVEQLLALTHAEAHDPFRVTSAP